MKLDIAVHKGMGNKPVVILIHGLGMDKNFWLNPLATKVFAKSVPLRVFTAVKPGTLPPGTSKKFSVGDIPARINCIWDALKTGGFNIICWSQRRPAGPISAAVEELMNVADTARRLFPKNPIALIGHSRGGLVARKFMEERPTDVRAAITISTPHRGSRIGAIGKYLKPCSTLIKKMLPRDTHTSVSKVIKSVSDLLESGAIKELLPGSEFLKGLKDVSQKGVRYISFGGTSPRLITFYLWKRAGDKMIPKPLLSIPDSLVRIFPSFMATDEITPGKGDGLVAAKSSLHPFASKHYNLNMNHLNIIWHPEVINRTLDILYTI